MKTQFLELRVGVWKTSTKYFCDDSKKITRIEVHQNLDFSSKASKQCNLRNYSMQFLEVCWREQHHIDSVCTCNTFTATGRSLQLCVSILEALESERVCHPEL